MRYSISYDLYLSGVLFAILSGICSNTGVIIQKKVVNKITNDLPSKKSLMRILIRDKIWILGLLINFGVGSIFYLLAQSLIGPALIPGLMASGLIILAIGSIFILNENLKKKEILGIFLMIIAITFLGFSRLSIEISESNVLASDFLFRVSMFTLILCIISILLEVLSRKSITNQGIPLAIFSGNMFALSNLWVSLLINTITKVFGGSFMVEELILFIVSTIILIATNMYGVIKMQQAFTVGQASNLIAIQQIPIQTFPILIYFLVFLMPLLNLSSFVYLILGISFIIVSAYLLGKRQVAIEKIGESK
ncbi:MAG: DMT family transporter [Promethearchaeia archaeon]